MRLYPKSPALMGEAVRKAREAAGLSQAQLARAIGASKASVSRWESGVCVPAPAARERLCREWGCPAEAFECWSAEEIAEAAEAARASLGMTKREFSRAADMSERMYCYYASGERVPTVPALARMIAAVLRASADREQAASLLGDLLAVYRSARGDIEVIAVLAA